MARLNRRNKKTSAHKTELSSGNKRRFVHELIHELAGFAPYEHRAMETLKNDRRRQARQFLKKRLGSNHHAFKRLERLEAHIQEEALEHNA